MTNTITAQNIHLPSWITLYIKRDEIISTDLQLGSRVWQY